jgi:hypothetical protein
LLERLYKSWRNLVWISYHMKASQRHHHKSPISNANIAAFQNSET